MRKLAFAFVVACLAVPAVAAPDDSSAAQQQQQQQPQKPKKEKKICRRVETSESRMGAAVCKTASEWEQGSADGAQKIGLGSH